MPTEHKLAAILSADIVGYSRLMAEDEDATVRRLGAYRTEITNLVADHRGRVVDFTGDNFLAESPCATDALECADVGVPVFHFSFCADRLRSTSWWERSRAPASWRAPTLATSRVLGGWWVRGPAARPSRASESMAG